MAFQPADRVRQVTTTTGLGTYNLDGVTVGFRSFVSGVGTGNRCTYCVENGIDWEINEGIVTVGAPDTLSRALFLASSTGSAINWSAGTRNIFAVYAAADRNPRTRKLTAVHSIASTTATEVVGLELANLQPGTYVAEYVLICRSTATGTGLKFGINFSGTATRQKFTMSYPTAGNSATTGIALDAGTTLTGQLLEQATATAFTTTAPNLGPFTGVSVANADILVTIRAIVEVTAAGNLELWHGSETATATSVEVASAVICTRIDG